MYGSAAKHMLLSSPRGALGAGRRRQARAGCRVVLVRASTVSSMRCPPTGFVADFQPVSRFELARRKAPAALSPEKGIAKRGSLLSFRRRSHAKPNAFMAVANAKSEPASPSKQASSDSLTRSPPQSPQANGQASTDTVASPGPSGVTKRPSARFQSTL